MRHSTGCQDYHVALIIIITFEGQDSDVIANVCACNNCAVVTVPHNLKNKFQPLDITVNKAAKCFINETYNKRFAEQVANQLNEGQNPADVDVTLKLSEVKPL